MSKLHMVQRQDLGLRQVSIHAFERHGNAMRLRKSQQPITATSSTAPSNYQRFQEYLFDLIIQAIDEDPKTRQAYFTRKEPGTAAARLDALYDKRPGLTAAEFHATSGDLARLLQGAIGGMKAHGAAALAASRPAYFLLAEFTAGDELCYAVLRLDHDQHLEVDIHTNGPPDLVVHKRDLPTSSRLKDKLAFIVPPEQRLTYDLMVTDRKYDPRSTRPLARYFFEGFLGADLVSDAHFFTEVFIDGVRHFARRHRRELVEADVRFDRYYSGLDHSLNRDRVTLKPVLEDMLPDQPALREELRADLHERGLTSASFRVSRDVVSQRMDRRRMVLSNGITIAGERDTMNESVSIDHLADGYQIEVETESFVEN
jgi:hypothetical protein